MSILIKYLGTFMNKNKMMLSLIKVLTLDFVIYLLRNFYNQTFFYQLINTTRMLH